MMRLSREFAEVRRRLDERFPGYLWQLNRDFAMHVLAPVQPRASQALLPVALLLLLPCSLVQEGHWQEGLRSEHGIPLSMVVVRIPDTARAEIAIFPKPVGDFQVDGMLIHPKWKGKRYISIVLYSTQTPQMRGQAGGFSAAAGIQHSGAAGGGGWHASSQPAQTGIMHLSIAHSPSCQVHGV
jgi:hypothetical protein